jgi:hypothetical protein
MKGKCDGQAVRTNYNFGGTLRHTDGTAVNNANRIDFYLVANGAWGGMAWTDGTGVYAASLSGTAWYWIVVNQCAAYCTPVLVDVCAGMNPTVDITSAWAGARPVWGHLQNLSGVNGTSANKIDFYDANSKLVDTVYNTNSAGIYVTNLPPGNYTYVVNSTPGATYSPNNQIALPNAGGYPMTLQCSATT